MTDPNYPLLGRVLPSRAVRGLDAYPPTDAAQGAQYHLAQAEPAQILLGREYGTDAHFLAYFPTNLGEGPLYTGDDYPRINKVGTALRDLRAAGTDLVTQWLVFDWDEPGHQPHASRARVLEVLDAFDRLASVDPELAPQIAYATRHGWRTLHALEAPLPADKAEQLHRSWIARLQEAYSALPGRPALPVHLDPGCSDWTRLFRCPRVTRDPSPGALLEHLAPWYAERFHPLSGTGPDARPPAPLPRYGTAAPSPSAHPLAAALRAQACAPPTPTAAGQTTPAPAAAQTQLDVPVYGEPPTDEEASALLDTLESPKGRELLLRARYRTRNRKSDRILWHNEELAPPLGPGRSNAIHEIAGDSAAWLYHCPGFTPELLYALLWVQVATWQPTSIPHPFTHAAEGRGWLLHLWQAIGKYWLRERKRVEENPQAFATTSGGTITASSGASSTHSQPGQPELSRLEQQHSLLGGICAGIARWPAPPADVVGPQSTDMSRQLWVLRHLIAIRGERELYVLRPDGFYDVHPTSHGSLIPTLQAHGIAPDLISLETATPSGALRPRAPSDIIRDHGVRIVSRSLCTGLWSPRGIPGGVIEQDSETPGVATMSFSAFSRARLEPCYDPQVDEWLRHLVGAGAPGAEVTQHLEPLYDRLQQWIAWALAFEEGPTAALALHGAPGAGKKLLARGLAEATAPALAASGGDLGKWQYGLAESPWLIVDEGIPDEVALSDRADVFRRLTAGEAFSVNQKNLAPYRARVPVRIVFTANNTDAISQLTGGRDLTSEDRAAIASRLVVIHVDEACPGWLARKGGIEHTRGWIDEDGGAMGHRRVARHFLWLHQQRARWPKGTRLLVEGHDDLALRRQLLGASKLGPFIVECVVRLIEQGGQETAIRTDPEGIWVTASAVQEAVRAIARKTPGIRIPSPKAISGILRGYCLPGRSGVRRFRAIAERPMDAPRPSIRWHGLDLELLLAEAEELGIDHPRLAQAAAGGEHMASISVRPNLTVVSGYLGGTGGPKT